MRLMGLRGSVFLAIAVVSITASACGGDDDEGSAGPATDAGAAMDAGSRDDGGAGDDGGSDDGAVDDGAVADGAASDAGAPLDDAESAHVVTTINSGEIELAMLAAPRAVTPEVEAYAEMMIEDHTAAQAMIDEWLESESETPEQNPVSTMLMSETARVRSMLEEQTGAAFDRAYIASQVAMHRDALMIIDGRLVPGAEDPQLRNILRGIRADVVEHIEVAEEIAEMLEGGARR